MYLFWFNKVKLLWCFPMLISLRVHIDSRCSSEEAVVLSQHGAQQVDQQTLR